MSIYVYWLFGFNMDAAHEMNKYARSLFQQILDRRDISLKKVNVECESEVVDSFEQRSSADLSTYLIHRLKAAMSEHEIGQITNIVLVPSKGRNGLGLSSCLKVVQTHRCLCCTYEKIYMFKFLMHKDKIMWTLDVSMG
jgi:hypothetical protein